MKKTVLARITMSLVTVAAIHLINTSQVTAQKYKIDNDHTSIVFAISHFGFSYTYGRFNQCAGSFDMVDGKPGEQGFEFTIDAKSIDTNCDERDEHLRGPDFFDTQQFPEITLKTTSIEAVDDEYKVTADLTILGQTRSVVLPTRLVGAGKGPFGKERAGFFTKFTIKRSDFGMDKMQGGIGDNVSITFSFEGVREKEEVE
jgi:polyisoprenoid-binding protein YceI